MRLSLPPAPQPHGRPSRSGHAAACAGARAEPPAVQTAAPLPKAAPQKPAAGRLRQTQTRVAAAAEPLKPAPVEGQCLRGIRPASAEIQAALLWAGDYTVLPGGDHDARRAVKNFQKRDQGQGHRRAHRRRARAPDRRGETHDDASAGPWSTIRRPACASACRRSWCRSRTTPRRARRWSSAHGEVQVETFRIKRPDSQLAALFEQQEEEPAARRVESSALQDDGFVISGMQGLKKFTVRATMRDGEVRGFTMLLRPGDGRHRGAGRRGDGERLHAVSRAQRAVRARCAEAVEYGTGLVVSATRRTSSPRPQLTDGCQVIVVSGSAMPSASPTTKAQGLALLRVYGARDLHPLALPAMRQAGDADAGRHSRSAEQSGDAAADGNARRGLPRRPRIELRQPVPMAGFAGAAALDAQGRFAGMVRDAATLCVASTEPAHRRRCGLITAASTIARFP